MTNPTAKTLGLSLALTTASTFGGAALADKFAGESAGQTFLFSGLNIVVAIVAVQIMFYFLGRNRLFYRLLFAGALSLTMLWFLLCLILPILWIATIPAASKAAIAVFTSTLGVFNFAAAFGQFKRKWKERGEAEFTTFYKVRDTKIDWDRVTHSMELATTLYIPGVPSRATPVVSALLILSMFLGAILRNKFPNFSIFAWGIPAAIIISIFVQMMGLAIAQAFKIRELEKKLGVHIRPMATLIGC